MGRSTEWGTHQAHQPFSDFLCIQTLYFAILRRPPFLYLLARALLSAGGEEAEGSGRGREGGTASLGTQGDWVQCLLSSSLLQSCSSLILCWGLLGQQRTEV